MPAKKKGVRGTGTGRPAASKKAVKKATAVKKTAKKKQPEKPTPLAQPTTSVTTETTLISAPLTMEEAVRSAPRPLVVSEVFSSIQGEGRFVGVPSTFVRLSGCNLRCVWCDTPYTSWKPEGASEWMLGGLLSLIRRLRNNHVVITGGEPMLQETLVLLTQRLREIECYVTIETAGTVYLPVQCDLMSISPKLANSVPKHREGGRWAVRHESLRYNPSVISKLMQDYDYQLKFVVQTPEDMDEVVKIVEEVKADPEKVVLMGEGIDPGTLFERGQWITEVCKNLGYRYTPRLHIDLWGNERGK